jgi:integrase
VAPRKRPFNGNKLTERADRALTAAKLDRITLHECRHTFASLMIAAGVNVEALPTFISRANTALTVDRCGHLIPRSEAGAAGLLDSGVEAQRECGEEATPSVGGVLTGA